MCVAVLAVDADAMSKLDDLPPDQRAVLLLLVQQGKSHAEIAEMLAIPESAVRDRAHAALDALTGETSAEAPGGSARPRGASGGSTRSGEASGGSARAGEAPGGSARSKEVSGSSARSGEAPSSLPPPRPRRPAPAPRQPAPSRSGGSPLPQTARARRTGALLLGAILAAIVVVIVLVSSSGGNSHKGSSANSTTSTSKTSAAGEPHIDKQLNLVAPDPASKAVGLVEVLSQGSKHAFLVTAEHLPPTDATSFYAAWLYNSPSDARVLGRAPNVSSNGKLQAVGSLPANAGHFHQMLITRETSTKPSRPGPIVLNGPFSLH